MQLARRSSIKPARGATREAAHQGQTAQQDCLLHSLKVLLPLVCVCVCVCVRVCHRFVPGEPTTPVEKQKPVGPRPEEIAAIKVSRNCVECVHCT